MKTKTSKRKLYTVNYTTTMGYDAVVEAKDESEAKKKVIEVIGRPIHIDSVWEVESYA